MNTSVYDDVALERIIQEKFGVEADVGKVIVRRADVSRTAHATLFLTKKKQLLLYMEASSPLLLADVKKLVNRMGLKAETFVPPIGRPTYFDDIGRAKFRDVFPGRTTVTSEDILFYKTLAPYNPALVSISEVKNGEIYQFDADARSGWRLATKFSYRRIRTS